MPMLQPRIQSIKPIVNEGDTDFGTRSSLSRRRERDGESTSFGTRRSVSRRGERDEGDTDFAMRSSVSRRRGRDEGDTDFGARSSFSRRGERDDGHTDFRARPSVPRRGERDEGDTNFGARSSLSRRGERDDGHTDFRVRPSVSRRGERDEGDTGFGIRPSASRGGERPEHWASESSSWDRPKRAAAYSSKQEMPERASYVRTFRRATAAEEPRAEAKDDTEPVFDKRLLTEEERPKRTPPSHPPPEQFRWKKKGRKIQIFHNPDDPTSCRVLKLLERARAEPFPPKSKHSQEPKLVKRRRRGGPTHILPPPPPPPLEYELHVRVGPPTAEQFRVLMALVSERAPSYVKAFLDPSQARYGAHATNERELAALVTADKRLLLWPIVVSWPARWAAVGSYKQVYAFLRRIADRRPLPKLEGTPVFDPEILAREVVQGPSYLAKHLTASDLAELEDITA